MCWKQMKISKGGETVGYMLFKNFYRDIYRDIEEETNKKYLDDDSLFFCCKHGLSVNKSDYTEAELVAIKAKALQEQEENRNKNRENLYNILNN